MLPRDSKRHRTHLFLIATFVAAWLSAISTPLLAETAHHHPTDRYRISVVTMGPGTTLFTRFGHTAIWVSDTKYNTQKLYNFGEFDYRQPNLLQRFLQGELQYWVGLGSFDALKKIFKKNRRSLTVQRLLLNPKENETLRHRLHQAVMPEHRNYRYNHYTANCSTKVRDILNDITGGLLKTTHNNPQNNLRHWTHVSLNDETAFRSLMHLILNHRVDAPITGYASQYLPVNLMRGLHQTNRADGTPLVSEKETLFPDRRQNTREYQPLIQGVAIGLVALVLALLLAAPILGPDKPLTSRLFGVGLTAYGLLSTAIDALLIILWVFTPHRDLHSNENLLLFPPSHLVLIPIGILIAKQKRLSFGVYKWLRFYTIAAAGLLQVNVLLKLRPSPQDNTVFLISTALYLALIWFSLKRAS